MSFKAFGFNLTDEHVKLITAMLANITSETVTVFDIRCFEPEVEPADIIIAYGVQAQRRLDKVKCRARIGFPGPDRLDMTHGDPEEIKLAQQKLMKFRDKLDLDTTQAVHTEEDTILKQHLNLTEELPTILTASDVKTLEEQQIKQGKTHWTGVTSDGRTVRVTVEPEEKTADINLTFAELHAVMGLKDTLRVKELEIVYKPSAITRKSSTQ